MNNSKLKIRIFLNRFSSSLIKSEDYTLGSDSPGGSNFLVLRKSCVFVVVVVH
jgi:hypothetical protein